MTQSNDCEILLGFCVPVNMLLVDLISKVSKAYN
jgi:hypothetical protein